MTYEVLGDVLRRMYVPPTKIPEAVLEYVRSQPLPSDAAAMERLVAEWIRSPSGQRFWPDKAPASAPASSGIGKPGDSDRKIIKRAELEALPPHERPAALKGKTLVD